jgi:hypothetical protein
VQRLGLGLLLDVRLSNRHGEPAYLCSRWGTPIPR